MAGPTSYKDEVGNRFHHQRRAARTYDRAIRGPRAVVQQVFLETHMDRARNHASAGAQSVLRRRQLSMARVVQRGIPASSEGRHNRIRSSVDEDARDSHHSSKAHWSIQKSRGKAGLPLLRLLQIYGKFEASDPRDKIYGLLALSLSHCANLDFSESPAEPLPPTAKEQIRFRVSYRAQPIDLFASALTSIIYYSVQIEHLRWRNAWGHRLVNFLLDLLGLPVREDIHRLAFASASQFLFAVS